MLLLPAERTAVSSVAPRRADRASVSPFGAVGFALGGYTLWVFADTGLKLSGASALPAFEVTALVSLAVVLLMLVYALVRGQLRALWPRQPGRQVLRSGLEIANNVCVVIALRHVPLALFYILIFASPMVTTLLAAVLLHERLELRKALAIVVGFLGVVVAVNPFGVTRPGDWTGYAACMVCVASFSTNMVWSRSMTQTETPESLAFCSSAVTVMVGFAAALGHLAPVSLKLGSEMTATGLFGLVGSLCFFRALRFAPAATVSQYHYSQLLTGALVGYLLWHERLSTSMLAGAVLIVGAGVYTAARSYGTHKDALVPVG